MFNRLIAVTCVVLAILVVVLTVQNLQLKRQLAEQLTPAGGLEPGMRLGPIQLVDPAGDSRPLSFSPDDPRTVLLFFTPDCPACRATLPVWRELFESIDSSARVLGVNLGPEGSSADELVTIGWPFPVFGVEPTQSEGLRRINLVPATVILGEAGIVERVWFGELDAGHLNELRRELVGD